MKKKLSIVIPSFNRIDFLKLNLEEIIEEATESDIQVILSQDGRNEKIMKFSKQLANRYDNFYFIEHTDRLGHDDNFLKCFDLHDSDYTWILGDSISIHEGSIREILDVIDKHSPDIIGLNADHRKIDHDHSSDTKMSKYGKEFELTKISLDSLPKFIQENREKYKEWFDLS